MIAATNPGIVGWTTSASRDLAPDGSSVGWRPEGDLRPETRTKTTKNHFHAMRPMLNGIEDVATRDDLLDRCVVLSLPAIPEDQRREESISGEFEAESPGLLGALLDAVVGGRAPHASPVQLVAGHGWPTSRWGEAAGRLLWLGEGAFLRAYEANRAAATHVAIEASPVALAVRALMTTEANRWSGTATELLSRLAEFVGEKATKDRGWPGNANALSGRRDGQPPRSASAGSRSPATATPDAA